MVHLDQTSNNKRSTQPTQDIIADKDCDHITTEVLHITNIERTHLIFTAIEKPVFVYNDQTVRFLLPQSIETGIPTSCMTMIPKSY